MFRYLFLLLFLFSCFSKKEEGSLKPKSDLKLNQELVEENCFCTGTGSGDPGHGGYTSNIPPDTEGIVADIDRDKSLFITDPQVIEYISSFLNFNTSLAMLHNEHIQASPTAREVQKMYETYLDGYSGVNPDFFKPNELLDVRQRDQSKAKIRANWQKDSDGNLLKAPYELIAILIRPELFKSDRQNNIISAGEIRLLYKFVENGNSIATQPRRNFVILEYEMPVDIKGLQIVRNVDGELVEKDKGAYSRADWLNKIGQLSCYKRDDILSESSYRQALLLLLLRSAQFKYKSELYPAGSALKGLQVNDFLQREWTIFSMKVNEHGFLDRARLEKTPKDNYADLGAIVNSGLVKGQKSDVESYIRDNFPKLANRHGAGNYQLPEEMLAWQNEFKRGASWLLELMDNRIVQGTNKNNTARNVNAVRNFSMNTCVSCHMSIFKHQQFEFYPDLNSNTGMILPDMMNVLGLSELKFSGLSKETPFVHIDRTDKIHTSEFIEEDLIYREQESELFMSALSCTEPIKTQNDLKLTLEASHSQAKVGDTVEYIYNVENLGPALAKDVYVKVECPFNTEKIDDVKISGGNIDASPNNSNNRRWKLADLRIGDVSRFGIKCKIKNTQASQINFQAEESQWEFDLADPDLANNRAYHVLKIGDESIENDANADFRVIVSSDKAEVEYDEEFKLTLQIRNLGDDQATASFLLPSGRCPSSAHYKDHSIQRGILLNGTGEWSQREIWSVDLRKNQTGKLTLTCQNKLQDQEDEVLFYAEAMDNFFTSSQDPVMGNNSDSLSISVVKKQDLVNCDYDYNNDGNISSIELLESRKIILGINQKDPTKEYDVNGDGNHSSIDLIELQKCILGILKADEVFNNSKCDTIIPSPPCK